MFDEMENLDSVLIKGSACEGGMKFAVSILLLSRNHETSKLVVTKPS